MAVAHGRRQSRSGVPAGKLLDKRRQLAEAWGAPIVKRRPKIVPGEPPEYAATPATAPCRGAAPSASTREHVIAGGVLRYLFDDRHLRSGKWHAMLPTTVVPS